MRLMALKLCQCFALCRSNRRSMCAAAARDLCRQRGRQPKARKQPRAERRHEFRDRDNRSLIDAKQLNGVRLQDVPVLPANIDGDGGLTVCTSAHQAKAGIELPGLAKERAHRLAALIPLSPRWHAVGDILSQEAYETIQIPAFPRLNVTVQQCALPVVGRQVCPTRCIRVVSFEGGASAL